MVVVELVAVIFGVALLFVGGLLRVASALADKFDDLLMPVVDAVLANFPAVATLATLTLAL